MTEQARARQDGGVIYVYEGRQFHHGIINGKELETCETFINPSTEKRCTCGKYLLKRGPV